MRGLDYYNRTVFEWTTTRLGAQGTICAGGRFDGLIEQMGGKPTPATGFAIGIERILALLQDDGMIAPRASLDAYVVHQGEMAGEMASLLAEGLRDQGLSALLDCGGGSFKSQMKRADASGASFAVILGDNETSTGLATLKSLRGGEQVSVPVDELSEKIKQLTKEG